MAEWHYAKGDRQFGPVTAAELKELARSGGLAPTDSVRKDGMAKWVPARQIKGLFAATAGAGAEPEPVPARPPAGISTGTGQAPLPEHKSTPPAGDKSHPQPPTRNPPRRKGILIAGGVGMCVLLAGGLALTVTGKKPGGSAEGTTDSAGPPEGGSASTGEAGAGTTEFALLDAPNYPSPPSSALPDRAWVRRREFDLPNPKCAALAPDRKTVAVGAESGLRLYDAATGAEVGVVEAEKRPGWVSAAAFSPNGAWLVYAGEYRPKIQIWDVSGRVTKASFDNPYSDVYPPGHPQKGSYHQGCEIAFTADPNEFVTAGRGPSQPQRNLPRPKPGTTGANDEQVIVWNVNRPQPVARLRGYSPVSVAAKKSLLACRGPDPAEVVVWDYTRQRPAATVTADAGKFSRVVAVALSPDGDRLAAVVRLGDDGKKIANFQHVVRLWRVGAAGGGEELRFGRGGGWDRVTAVLFSPDGATLVVAGDCLMSNQDDRVGLIQMVDLKTGKVASLMGHRRRVEQIALPPGGRACVSLSGGAGPKQPGEVRVWEEGATGAYPFVDPNEEQRRLAEVAREFVARKLNQRKTATEGAAKEELARVEEMRGQFGASPPGYTRKVLTADPSVFAGEKHQPPPDRKGVVPKYAPGTVGDLLQAVSLASRVRFSALRHRDNNNAYGAFCGLKWSPASWTRFFGEPQQISPHRGPNGIALKKWVVPCTDGTVRFVGDIIPESDMVLVQVVEWDVYVPEFCQER